MSAYIYCLYSTEDGVPRYVGKVDDKVGYRFNEHVTAALEQESGARFRSNWHGPARARRAKPAPSHQLDLHLAPDQGSCTLQGRERHIAGRVEQPVHL